MKRFLRLERVEAIDKSWGRWSCLRRGSQYFSLMAELIHIEFLGGKVELWRKNRLRLSTPRPASMQLGFSQGQPPYQHTFQKDP